MDGSQTEELVKCEQSVNTSKKEWKGPGGITSHPPSQGHWRPNHLTARRWESEKKSWNMPVEGLGNHVATDGSLLGVRCRWCACGWSVVQLDHDEVMVRMHRMYGTLDAELEVQLTIKMAEFDGLLVSPLESDWSRNGPC